MYQDDAGEVIAGLSTASHLAVGVPGSVDGLLAVLEKYGTMQRRELMQRPWTWRATASPCLGT